MVKPVTNLLNKLEPEYRKHRKEIRTPAEQALNDFSDHLQWLVKRHAKESYQEKYLLDGCFAKSRIFKTDAEVNAYCRVHLYVAVLQFQALLKDMTDDNGKIPNKNIKRYATIIREYIFDLKDIAEHLERQKDKDYVFFSGSKSYGVMSWQVFRLSCQLAVQSTLARMKSPIEHRPAQIASIFVLRQALETKFDKLIGVFLHDSNGQSPRIRHDFKYNFIKDNKHFFDFKAANFESLKVVYDWCNEIVHGVYQPFAWQIAYAHQICGGLFWSLETAPGEGWSINNAVEVMGIGNMQAAYVSYFLNEHDKLTKNDKNKVIWVICTREPEAVLK